MTQISRNWRWAMPLAAMILGLAVGGGLLLVLQAVWGREARLAAPARVRVTSPVTTVADDKAFTPEADQNLVVFTLSVTNTSRQTESFLPSVQTYIRDDEGGTYAMHPSMGVTNPIPATDLAPGQTVSGQVSYAIPAALSAFHFYFDPRWDDMGPLVFKLSR